MIQSRRALLLTLAVFALQPMALAGWLTFIPLVKETLGLSKAELALALLGLPVAIIPGLQIAGRVIERVGPRKIMALAFPAQAVAVLLPLLAVSLGTLFLALMAFGAVVSFTQVCLNVYAGRLEKELGRSVMNRCHGLWALGLMVGPLLVVALSGLPPLGAVAVVAGVAGALGAWAARSLPALRPAGDGSPPPRRSLRQIPPALAAISLFALAVAMTEGAMADWAAVYLSERLPEGSRWVALGISVYAGFLAGGRLAGDWMKDRIGAVALGRATYGLAMAGLLLLVLPLPLPLAFMGFALVGAGASVGFPLGVSAAAALDDRHEGGNIAIMSSVAICGFLIGPPMIGFLAESWGLRVGLAALLPVLALGIALSGALRPAESPDSAASHPATR